MQKQLLEVGLGPARVKRNFAAAALHGAARTKRTETANHSRRAKLSEGNDGGAITICFNVCSSIPVAKRHLVIKDGSNQWLAVQDRAVCQTLPDMSVPASLLRRQHQLQAYVHFRKAWRQAQGRFVFKRVTMCGGACRVG